MSSKDFVLDLLINGEGAKGVFKDLDTGVDLGQYQEAYNNAPPATKRAILAAMVNVDDDTPLLYALLGQGTPPLKMSKDAADYQDEARGDQACRSCEFYYEGADGDAICAKVRGQINEDAWCRLWESVESQVSKGRTYIDSPADAPEGVEVQQGERGGLYYEEGDEDNIQPPLVAPQLQIDEEVSEYLEEEFGGSTVADSGEFYRLMDDIGAPFAREGDDLDEYEYAMEPLKDALRENDSKWVHTQEAVRSFYERLSGLGLQHEQAVAAAWVLTDRARSAIPVPVEEEEVPSGVEKEKS